MTALPAGHPSREVIADIVTRALAEDRAVFDVTTQATVPPDQQGEGEFVFKEPGVVCGLEVARAAFAHLSPDAVLDRSVDEGAWVEAGRTVASIRGPLAAILSAERVALNLVQRMSGTATLARQYVEEAAKGGPARVLDTRKTTPGLRALERYAVRTGGAHNHRNTLEDGVLIKDNHLAAAARRGLGITALLAEVRQRAPHTVRIEVEVTTPEQAREAVEAGADIVLLDNMSTDVMRPIVAEARRTPRGERVLFEASGGVRLDTIAAIAATGVDLVSVGALTHSARALDISLEVRPE